MNGTARNLTLLVLLALPSCTILAPQPDESRFYLLTPSPATGTPPASSRGLVIGLGPTKMPDYLLRSEIGTRVSANRMVYADHHRWAEPLERNFNRVVAENLSSRLGTAQVITLPSYLPIAVNYEVPLEILHFEQDEKGVVQLAARWAIRNPANGKFLVTRESGFSEAAAGSDTESAVAALSLVVGKLSEEIAGEIVQLSAAPEHEKPSHTVRRK
jgi:uncharacterized lipoprotein YmbA